MMISFSTMWAQQTRFADLARFRSAVAALGFGGIEVSHSTDERGLQALLAPGEIPLTSLHAPTPRRVLPDDRLNSDANLASTDEAERTMAVAEHLRTIDYAAAASLPYVVVHLGGVGEPMTDQETHIRELVQAGTTEGEQIEALRDDLRRWRAQRIDAHLDAARRSLRELIERAAPHGIALGLESRLHYHEIPHPQEAIDLLAAYDNTTAGYWHDVGHCEVQARLGLINRDTWFPLLTPRTIGCHLHDVDGLADHRAPGNGDVDWRYIAAGIPSTALHVFEVDQRQPDDKVAAAIDFLRTQGVIE